MSVAIDELLEESLESLRFEKELTVSQWADSHRILSSRASAAPGPWSTDRTPYLRGIMDALSASDPVQRVVFMKGAQLGATEVTAVETSLTNQINVLNTPVTGTGKPWS